MRETKIDKIVNCNVHKDDESSISGLVGYYSNYLSQGRVVSGQVAA